MISPNRISYQGFSSRDFKLLCDLAFDSDDGDTNTFLNREAVASETYRGEIKKVHGYKYVESFAPKFTFIKENYEDFTVDEQRRILAWLTSKHTPSFLTVYHDDTSVISYEVLGAFIEVNTYKLGNGRVVGFVAIFESVAPYAYSELKGTSITVTEPTTLTINCQSDELKSYVYPRITITEGDSVVVNMDQSLTLGSPQAIFSDDNYVNGTVYHYNGTYYWVDTSGNMRSSTSNTSDFNTTSVTISNETLGIKTHVGGNTRAETVVVDGANRLVYSDTRDNRIFGNDFNWTWLPLAVGENQLKIMGNCQVTLEWREPRKTGEY